MSPEGTTLPRAPDGPLWRPDPARAEATALAAFRARIARAEGCALDDYAALHRWSVAHPERFWRAVWELGGVLGEPGERVLVPDPGRARGARWFPEARFAFAENLLRGDPERPALVALREDGTRRELSLGALRGEVARWRAALAAAGVAPGERVAAWLPNGSEAVAAMLATAALGATWSSCSPDFGPAGVLDRFQPLAPRVLIACDGHVYRGKAHDARARLAEVVAGLPSLVRVVVVPWLDAGAPLPAGALDARTFLAEAPAQTGPCPRFPFEQPLYVVFSSGTTGKPKCIVHGAGGTLLQHLKEHRLQCDIRRGDRVFFHSTLGWMMWNWLVSALASEATVVLYDGDPLLTPTGLLELAAREELTFLGCSARYFETLAQGDVRPPRPLPALRTVASTGSPLAPEAFEHVYRALGPDLHLASISGGTDILSCFVGGDPTGPVWRGEIQAPGLGMDVDVLGAAGEPLAREPGELVCRPPFPSMPLGFWNDPGDAAYRRAYFERFPGLWHHGDWARRTEHGGIVILGRSDATLNVNGVRIGSAEITREVAALAEVQEAVAVEVTTGGREGIALVVQLAPGVALGPELAARIRARLRERQSPRHVPRHLLAVPDLPRTRSGKLSESAVRAVLNGREPDNRQALANPEVLAHLGGLELA
ncbi:MAG TPA: acetoacetate--CoA ligase [Planctomycetota bacterium]